MDKAETLKWAKEALKAIPDLGKLLLRLARDPRVPRKNKLLFAGIAAYVLLPVDFLPDKIPGIGQVDDLVLVVLALDAMVNHVPREVLYEHWEGDEDVLARITAMLAMVTKFVPDNLKKKFYAGEDEQNEVLKAAPLL